MSQRPHLPLVGLLAALPSDAIKAVRGPAARDVVEDAFGALGGRWVVVGPATELTLRQGQFATEARLALHRDGWSDSFTKLRALLEPGS